MDTSRLAMMREKMRSEIDASYVPKLLTRQPRLFSPGMIQVISRGERAFTRADEHIGASPYRDCVKAMTLNIEAICSAIIDGGEYSLMDLLMHDIKRRGLTDAEQADAASKASTPFDAIWYRERIEKCNSCSNMGSFVFDTDSLDDLHRQLVIHSRPKSMHQARNGEGATLEAIPFLRNPLPEDQLREYVDDLCKFCNTDIYSPLIQTGLAHFQLECIRPYETGLDSLGRQITYIIYAKRGFSRHVPVAVAVESIRRVEGPGSQSKQKVESQAKRSALEMWIYNGAKMLVHEADTIMEMEQAFANIENGWRERIVGVRRDDICDVLLHDLLAHPIVNAKYIAERCEKTLPAANDAVRKLADAGVIEPIDSRKRNRYFYAADIVRYYELQLESILPNQLA